MLPVRNIIYCFLIITLLLNISGVKKTCAQDIHFSQYKTTPLLLNPANTGNFNGNMRITNNYRSQWVSFSNPGYNSLALAYDQPLMFLRRNFSIGGIVLYDKSGAIGMTITRLGLSASYKKSWGNNKYIFGIQSGGIMRQFNNANALFSSQFDDATGNHNPLIPSGESGLEESTNYFTLNAGIVWQKSFSRLKTEMGIAAFNLNHPKTGLTGSYDRYSPQFIYTLEATIYNSARLHLTPSILFMQMARANNLLAGVDLRLLTGKSSAGFESISFGSYIRSGFNRNTDAAIVSTTISFFKFRIGISYDLNISELQQYTNSVGAFELSLIYTGISTIFDPGALPCARQ